MRFVHGSLTENLKSKQKLQKNRRKKKRDIKEKNEMTSMEVEMERIEQESTVTRRDCVEYKKWLYMVEKVREQNGNLVKRRMKAMRFGEELSFLVAELMFLIPNKILASESEDYYTICTTLFGINEDDKAICVIMGKLEAVFRIIIWKKKNKEHDVNLPKSILRYDDFFCLCADAMRVLGKIVWALQINQYERLKLSYLDYLFEDCQKVLDKIDLKQAEIKQCLYRSVSADYDSFSKSVRSDRFLREKLIKRANADNRFGRSLIEYYFFHIWKTLFEAKALPKQ